MRRVLLLMLACAAVAMAHPPRAAAALDQIVVDGQGFREAARGRPFEPWGFNYWYASDFFKRPTPQRLERVRRELRRWHEAGANIVRIYLQLPVFMQSPTTANPVALQALRDVLRVAEEESLRVDVTGNLVWEANQSPAWYDRLFRSDRWAVQAAFWRAVASVGARSSAVMFYELTSEPTIGELPKPPTLPRWYLGEFGGYSFIQTIAHQLPGESADKIARDWIAVMRQAIARRDPTHLVSIGLLPSTEGPFRPANVAPLLDFLTVHEYPLQGRADASIATIAAFARARKPVVLGETFALYSDLETQEEFLLGSRRYLSGYMTFVDSPGVESIDRPKTSVEQAHHDNLEQWIRLRPRLLGSGRD